jgi:hypothetical protein
MDPNHFGLHRKVLEYKNILSNTDKFREVWRTSLRDHIVKTLKDIVKDIELQAYVDVQTPVVNLEAVVLSLGVEKSGLAQRIDSHLKRDFIKQRGSLIYQQLFNGKIIVLIQYPFIENYGQPHEPKTIAIYRPEELLPDFFMRHLEEFMTEITQWEDFDDDLPAKRIGFPINAAKS